MAQIILNIPDAVLPRVVDAISGLHDRPDTVDDGNGNQIPNPETKGQFAKRILRQWFKAKVVVWEGREAGKAAEASARASAEADIVIT